MAINDEDDWAKAQGYDSFSDYAKLSDLPSSTGIGAILDRAYRIVCSAYHGDQVSTTENTDFLGDWEIIVANRIIDNARARDSGQQPVYKQLLTKYERRIIAFRNDEMFNSSDMEV